MIALVCDAEDACQFVPVAAAEGYGPVVRVTAKARSDPRTLPVGMRGVEGFGE